MTTAENPAFPFPAELDDVVAHAPVLPFAYIVGTDTNQSFDPATESNLVIIGPSELGKTNAVRMLAGAARTQGALAYGVGSADSRDSFDRHADGLEAAEDLIQFVHAEMRARLALAAAAGVLSVDELDYEDRPERIFLILDELAFVPLREITPEGTDEGARQSEYRMYLRNAIDSFATIGQLARIHVILTARSSDGVTPTLREHSALLDLGSRGPADQGAAAFAVGRGTYKTEGEQPVYVQMWAAPTDEPA
jgi:hypothetical protein